MCTVGVQEMGLPGMGGGAWGRFLLLPSLFMRRATVSLWGAPLSSPETLPGGGAEISRAEDRGHR